MLQQTDQRTLRLLEFADYIEGLPDDKIALRGWFGLHNTACYGGHAMKLYATAEEMTLLRLNKISGLNLARRVLFLDSNQAYQLFIQSPEDKKVASKMIREFAYVKIGEDIRSDSLNEFLE